MEYRQYEKIKRNIVSLFIRYVRNYLFCLIFCMTRELFQTKFVITICSERYTEFVLWSDETLEKFIFCRLIKSDTEHRLEARRQLSVNSLEFQWNTSQHTNVSVMLTEQLDIEYGIINSSSEAVDWKVWYKITPRDDFTNANQHWSRSIKPSHSNNDIGLDQTNHPNRITISSINQNSVAPELNLFSPLPWFPSHNQIFDHETLHLNRKLAITKFSVDWPEARRRLDGGQRKAVAVYAPWVIIVYAEALIWGWLHCSTGRNHEKRHGCAAGIRDRYWQPSSNRGLRWSLHSELPAAEADVLCCMMHAYVPSTSLRSFRSLAFVNRFRCTRSVEREHVF